MSVCFRTDEGSRRKCGQYWPLEEGGQEVYSHMAVVNQRVDHHTHYNHTTLELHNTEVQSQTTARMCVVRNRIVNIGDVRYFFAKRRQLGTYTLKYF